MRSLAPNGSSSILSQGRRYSLTALAYAPTKSRPTSAPRAAAPASAVGVLHGLNAGPVPAQPPQRFSPDSVLPLLSSAVESSAQVARFEALAGRSAMIGFLVALAFETTEHSVFTLAPDQLPFAAAAFSLCIAAAAALAAASGKAPASAPADFSTHSGAGGSWWGVGARVHEAVMSSLTATQRSASGVTQLKVDEVVDFVVERCLTQAVHPVFGPLRDAGSAVATVGSVVGSILSEDRNEPPH